MNEEKKVKIFHTWDKFNYFLMLFFLISLIIAGFYLAIHAHNIFILLATYATAYLLALMIWEYEVKYEAC